MRIVNLVSISQIEFLFELQILRVLWKYQINYKLKSTSDNENIHAARGGTAKLVEIYYSIVASH